MFGSGFWERPRHGRGRRRFKRGMLRWIVLKMLETGGRHGYDFLSFFQMRGWSPGAGSIYPLLASLEAEGLVQGSDEGGRRVYTITDEGRRRLREDAPPWPSAWNFEDFFESEEHPMNDETQGSFDRLAAAWSQAKQIAKPDTMQQIVDIINEARKDIYSALADE